MCARYQKHRHTDSGKILQEWIENNNTQKFTADISADGTKVVSTIPKMGGAGPNAGNIKIWDAQTGKELRKIEHERMTCQSVSFIPGTKNIVISNFRDPALIIDVETGDPVSLLSPPLPKDIGVAHVSADGRKIVTALMTSYHTTGARVWTLQKTVASKERYTPPEPPKFPTYTGEITRTDTTMTGVPTILPPEPTPPQPPREFPTLTGEITRTDTTMTGVPTILPPEPQPPQPPPVCTCSACCSCKCTCGKWTGRICDKTASPTTGCKCHEIVEPPTADFTLEGIWRQFVENRVRADYNVVRNRETQRYEMTLLSGEGGTISNVQFDGKTWSFDLRINNSPVKYTLTKVDNNTFEGIVDGNQKNKWVRQVPLQPAVTFTAEEQAAIDDFLVLYSDVKAVDENNNTLLHLVAQSEWSEGSPAIAKYLISQGINVNAKNNGGWTPLHCGACFGIVEAVQYLVPQGADVHAKCNLGATPIQYAALNGHLAIIKYLVSQGADINAKNNEGETALDIAKEEDHTEIVKYLESVGGKSGN